MKRDVAFKIVDYLKNTRNVITEEMALNYVALYPSWKIGKELSVGDRVKHNGKLYKVVQAHTTQNSWTPDLTPSLFEPIDVVNEGTLENPIIAAAGMCYFKDKYYLDETDGKIYLCVRDDSNGNGTILYHMPSMLTNTYFKLIN